MHGTDGTEGAGARQTGETRAHEGQGAVREDADPLLERSYGSGPLDRESSLRGSGEPAVIGVVRLIRRIGWNGLSGTGVIELRSRTSGFFVSWWYTSSTHADLR